MFVSFLDNIETLPADRPENHPHFIDISIYKSCNESEIPNSGKLKLWDAVATMLYNISPAMLSDFLDPERQD